MEADDDRAGRPREQNVALGDRTDAAVNDLHLDLGVRQLRQRVGERFRRTALVGLDEHAKRPLLAGRCRRHEVFERDRALARAAALRFAVEPLATLRDLARLRRILDDEELVAGHRHAREAEHLHRNRRTRRLDLLAALVEQRAHATGVQADR